MPMPASARATLCACFFFLVAAAPAAYAAPVSPVLRVAVGQSLEEAAQLLERGKAEEAYALYMRLLRESPEDDAVNLGLTRAALATGRLPQATLALERLVDRHPKDAALRVELSRLYIRAGNTEAARQELLMAQRYDPSMTEEKASAVVSALAKQASPWQIAGRISGGILYDSNVNSGVQSRDISLGGLNLRLDEAATNAEAWGEYLNASLNGAYRISPDSLWWIVGDAAGYAKYYNRSVPSNQSFLWGRFGLGLRRLSPTTLLDLRLKLEQAIYDPHQEVTIFGPEVSFAWTAAPWAQLISRGGIEHREYLKENGRSGTYWWVGQYARLLFGPQDTTHEFIAGVRLLGSDVDTREYDYLGWEGSARLVFRLPYGFELSPFALWREESYRGAGTALEHVLGASARKDENFQTGAFITYHWTQNLSTDLGYQFVKNMSNSALYEYEQHIVNIGMTWTF